MASIQEKIDRISQIEKNTAEGARFANTYSSNLSEIAAELQATVQGSQTGERAVYVVQDASSELSSIATALSEACAEMQNYLSLIRS